MFVSGNLVTWQSNKQDVVTWSSTEAETMVSTTCELPWLNLLIELGFEHKSLMSMHYDNQSVIYIAKNYVYHNRTKQIKIDCYLVQDYLVKKVICTLLTPLFE